MDQDISLISTVAPHYRMSLMWSKLQRSAFADFDDDTVQHYHKLLTGLRAKNVSIMLVLHHFANPVWFAEKGSWTKSSNIAMFLDYAHKIVKEFGKYVA